MTTTTIKKPDRLRSGSIIAGASRLFGDEKAGYQEHSTIPDTPIAGRHKSGGLYVY